MGKKKLDELVREKFQGFSEIPDEKVWKRLEDSLDKKNSRRLIPLWWKLAGVAAGLLIAFWAINPFENTNNNTPTITDTEQNHKKDTDTQQNQMTTPFEEKIESREDAIVDTKDGGEKELQKTVEDSSKDGFTTTESSETKKDNSIETSNQKGNQPLSPNLREKGSQTILADQNREKTDYLPNKVNTPSIQADEAVANVNKTDPVNSIKEKGSQSEDRTTAVAQNDSDSDPIQNGKNRKDLKSSTKETVGEGIAQTEENVGEKSKDPENQKKSIFDEIKDQQEEEEAVAESSTGRWSAGPSIAPVFYSAFGEGSPVHSIFVPNSKSGDTNLSYGLSIAYEISDKLSVRSGVHRVDYGYGTDDIEFTASLEGSNSGQIDNIDYALNSRSLVVQSKAGQTTQSVNEMPAQALDVNAVSPAREGTMSQQFGYLEVPLELNYALVDKKFGVNLIGGFSSLFLVDNSVALTSGNETLEVGEANNVNSVNFSTNVGFGLNYNFTSKVRLNIEPVFKYQLNTFSNVDGTFQPFSVGVYSGLSFRF